MSLHDQLARVAERAPEVRIPPDTFARAARSRRRERLGVAAAVIAVVALVGGLAAYLPGREAAPPVASTSRVGLPDHLYAVPSGVPATGGLAVGRTAAAWIDTLHRQAVLVGAEDGAYHVVDLPGLNDVPIFFDPMVALSPDGYHLAWAWGDETDHRTGIRVVDLRTGRTSTVPLDEAEGVSVLQLAFSPDGRWLGWSGAVVTTWTDAGISSDRLAFGRLDVRTGTPDVLRSGGSVPDPSVVGTDDRGHVLVLDPGHVTTLGDRDVIRTEADAGRVAGPAIVHPTSGLIAAGVGGTGPTDVPAPGTAAVIVDPGSGTVRGYPSTAPEAYTTALGWVGRDVLVAVAPIEGSSVGPEGRTLELVGPGHGPRVVGRMDALVPYTLSIASDLVTPGRPTVARPAPDWPMSDARRAVLIGLGVAGALALVCGAWWLGRRRTRLK